MKNISGNKFQKAWDSLNSRIIDIKDLPKSRNGKNCRCTCVECNKALEACQGFVRAWYFRHQHNTQCSGGPMTAIHLLAQQLLIGNHTINTRYGSISYIEAVDEVPLAGSNFRADVLGKMTDGNDFLIEILVSHAIETEKTNFLKSNKIQSIEIDLSRVDQNVTEEDLLELLLNDTSKQRVIYLPEHEIQIAPITPKAIAQKPWYEDFIPFIIVGIIALFFYLKGQRNKSRKVWRNRRWL